ncbi:CRISPR-associated RecB family exonuclease Cas4 [hydrothermal vent metagenome]|uniref:5' to 3' exodeoxyribonuclease (nucleoside 3'-phosphate-forming) n=1 Tax=hydrothermal vent metagenome TaxID=652676 RepID=A0A3B1BU05_9ZZZZ
MTGTQIAYYFLCERKLWLFTHKIAMEQNSDVVAMGRFISDTTYERKKHEIRIDNIVLDNYDSKTKTIHEVKKSDKMEETHIWQVKYYISVLKEKGIDGVKGKIDYPKLRQTVDVELTEKDIMQLGEIEKSINTILNKDKPPDVINKSFCKKCSYYDLCYI